MSETNAKASEAEKEQAYRSGFRHAVAYLLAALNDQVTPDQMSALRRWEGGEMENWYRSDIGVRTPPPVPKLKKVSNAQRP